MRCPKCGTLVGFDENGRPYRIPFAKIVEALAHRDRALEWLGAQWGREKFFTEGDQWKGPRCDLCGRQTPTLRELYYGLEAIA